MRGSRYNVPTKGYGHFEFELILVGHDDVPNTKKLWANSYDEAVAKAQGLPWKQCSVSGRQIARECKVERMKSTNVGRVIRRRRGVK